MTSLSERRGKKAYPRVSAAAAGRRPRAGGLGSGGRRHPPSKQHHHQIASLASTMLRVELEVDEEAKPNKICSRPPPPSPPLLMCLGSKRRTPHTLLPPPRHRTPPRGAAGTPSRADAGRVVVGGESRGRGAVAWRREQGSSGRGRGSRHW
jgi:hypothetical protein